jgi:hypothetical protein
LRPNKFIFIILTIALFLRLYLILSSDYISPDGTHYATLGYNLLHEFKYQSDGAQFPDIIQPPLYPVLLGLVSLFFPAILAGKIVSLIFGIGLVMLVYHFVKFLKPVGNLAHYAALLIAVHPGLIAVSSQVATESLYLFLMMAIFVQGWFFICKPTLKKILTLALIFVLAFLTRPEALLFFVVFIFIQIVLVIKKRAPFKFLFIHLAIFILGASVYGLIVSQELGYFSISPKINFVRVQGKFQAHQKRLIEQTGQQIDNKEVGLKARYALSADSSQLATHALLFKDAATINIMNSSKLDSKQKSSTISGLLRYILYNLKMVVYRIAKGVVTPIVFIVFFMIGVFVLRKSFRHRKQLLLYAILMISPLTVYLITHIEERFLYLIIPFGIVFFSAGLSQISSLSEKIIIGENKRQIVLTLLVIISLIPSYIQLMDKMEEKGYYPFLAEKLERVLQRETKIASLVPQVSFFSGLKYCPVPFASVEGLVLYLKHQKANYLLIEEADLVKRPSLSKIVNNDNESFTKLIHGTISEKNYWLYKFETY